MKDLCNALLMSLLIAVQGLAQGEPPVTPTLNYPPDGTVGLPLRFAVKWDTAANASFYHLQISTDSTFTSTFRVNDSMLTATTRSMGFGTGECSTVFFWRVRAKNAAGASAFSSPWKFKTALAAPRLAFPGYDATDLDTINALTWYAVPEVSWYRVQLARDSLFQSVVRDTNVGPATYALISGLEHNQKYFWRVASNNSEALDIWSYTRKFRTFAVRPQHGLPSETKSSILSGNNVEVVYYNMGEFGDWMNQPVVSFVWPKGSEHTYIDGTAFIVQARAVTDSGKTFTPWKQTITSIPGALSTESPTVGGQFPVMPCPVRGKWR